MTTTIRLFISAKKLRVTPFSIYTRIAKKRGTKIVSVFVVDLGFSSAKWLNEKNQGMVASCYRKTKEDCPDSYSYKEESYIVGERALLETGSQYIRTVEELLEKYPLFVSVCLKRSSDEFYLSSGKDSLIVGLPYEYWKSEADKVWKGRRNAIDQLVNDLTSFTVNSRSYQFSSVDVYPQGLGGIKAYLAQNECKGNILGIDVGFNTVIYTLYSCEEKEILTGKTFYKKGLHEMAVSKLLPILQSKGFSGKSFTPIELNHVIRTGFIQSGFDKIDLTPEIREASDEYFSDTLQLIIGDLKAHSGVVTFDTIVFFGGGARMLTNKVKSEKVKVEILSQPEYANAVGFMLKAQETANLKGRNCQPSGSDTKKPCFSG